MSNNEIVKDDEEENYYEKSRNKTDVEFNEFIKREYLKNNSNENNNNNLNNNIITIYKNNVQLNAENYLKFRLVINTFIKITIFLLILLIIIVSCYLINQTRTSQKINQNVIEKLKYTSFV